MTTIDRPIVTPTLYVHAVELGDDELERWYAEQLDEPAVAEAGWMERPDALRLSALHYARRYGLPVLPLAPGRKVPIGGRCCDGAHARGVTDATLDPTVVDAVWQAHPTANVGVATGHGFDVIDQDGAEGARSWIRDLALDKWPAVLGVVTTPRAGGVHRYIASTGFGNGARVAPGIDYRGAGGYVVAPPSVVNGKRYGWVAPLDAR